MKKNKKESNKEVLSGWRIECDFDHPLDGRTILAYEKETVIRILKKHFDEEYDNGEWGMRKVKLRKGLVL